MLLIVEFVYWLVGVDQHLLNIDLTSGRVTYAGGTGELQDSGNLSFDAQFNLLLR